MAAELYLTDIDSVKNSLAQFNIYERATGAKLNKNKSNGLWAGSLRHRTDSIEGINFSNKKLQILGVWFGNSNLYRENWNPVLTKFRNCLNLWKMRNLTFKGRAIVANILGASKLWYLASFDHVPKDIINEANKILWDFIWKGKREIVKKKVLSKDIMMVGNK